MKFPSEAQRRHPKILPRTQLARRSAVLRSEGKTVVLTNGCFDLLHVGHTRYLQRARGLGDVLIVGANSDETVHRLKGGGRPLVPQEERAEILAALESVDFVTIFDEPKAEELVRASRPHIYVKGGDYSSDPAAPRFPVEGHLVMQRGGTVHIVPLEAGHSTSALLEKIRQLSLLHGGDC